MEGGATFWEPQSLHLPGEQGPSSGFPGQTEPGQALIYGSAVISSRLLYLPEQV